jgi:hypothetical protein
MPFTDMCGNFVMQLGISVIRMAVEINKYDFFINVGPNIV